MRKNKIVIALILLCSIAGCKSAEEKARVIRQEQEKRQAVSAISELRARYNPVVDWPEHLRDKTFSIDVDPIFLRTDGRPLLFYANLEDVKKQDDTIFLYLRTTPTEHEPTLQLILDCAGCNLQAFRQSSDGIGDFGVVAQVSAADKSLDLSEDAPDFVLHGKLIAARWIGDYAFDEALKNK